MATKTKKEKLLEEAKELGLEVSKSDTVNSLQAKIYEAREAGDVSEPEPPETESVGADSKEKG